MSDLLHAAKSLGLPCRGRHMGRVVTTTQDPEIAERMRQMGASVLTCYGPDPYATQPTSAMPRSPAQTQTWEISFPDDAA